MSEKLILVLVSSSPRRSELLKANGLDFIVRPVQIDEDSLNNIFDSRSPFESAREVVRRTAIAKAELSLRNENEVVLAADTLVVSEDGKLLGQPRDRNESRKMIEMLSGKVHFVHTGLAMFFHEIKLSEVASASVEFKKLSSEDISEYVDTGEGDDKAGAYAYQGFGRKLIKSVKGDSQTVIGLPIRIVMKMLNEIEDKMKPC